MTKIKDMYSTHSVTYLAWTLSILTVFMILTNNIILKWFVAEMCTIMVIYKLSISNKPMAGVYYYMISGISMIIMTLMIMVKCNLISFYSLNILFQILLFLKLAIYPFSNWFINMFEFMSWKQIFIMSTFMKIIPIILFKEMNFSVELIYYIVLSNVIISIESLKYNSLKKIFACSSITQNFMFLILIYSSKSLFLLYSLFYIILIYLIVSLLELNFITTKHDLVKLNSKSELIYCFLIICYMFLPPAAMFMMKWTFMFNALVISSNFMWMIMFIYTISNLLMLWNYFNLIKIPSFTLKSRSSPPLPHPFYPLVFSVFFCFMIICSIFMSMY